MLLLVGSMFSWGVISWLSKQLIEAVGLRPVDRTLGALFGVLRGGLLLLVLALVIQYTPLHKALWWQDSVLAPWLTEALGWVLPALPEDWGQYLPKASS